MNKSVNKNVLFCLVTLYKKVSFVNMIYYALKQTNIEQYMLDSIY